MKRSRELRAAGLDGGRRYFSDFYHYLLICRWRSLFAFFLITCLAVNCGFALLYLVGGNTIENAQPGSFLDAFFFSTQTLSTLGYGYMHPVGHYANILVSCEAVLGLLGFAMCSGLMFAKFARPTAKVLFSRNAVVARRDGIPSLMFRMANGRKSQVIGAQLDVTLVRTETTAEGETIRKLYDLPLTRGRSPVFALTWTAIHPIDQRSPLAGETAESLRKCEAQIFLTFTGMEATFSQSVYSRHTYRSEEILWSHRFADILTALPDGTAKIDYLRFNDTEPDLLSVPAPGA